MATKDAVVHWATRPQEHDYPAAASYLSLIAGRARVRALVKELRAAPVQHFQAKDLLRAAGLVLLPRDNPHVAGDLATIAAGGSLSPCLVVRGRLRAGRAAHIADGYHRICASYWTNEDTEIPVKIVPS